MKSLSLTLILTVLFTGFLPAYSQTDDDSYDYALENMLMDHCYSYYKEQGIDIKLIMSRVEDVYIKHHILEDRSGDSYIKLLEKIRQENNVLFDCPGLAEDIQNLAYVPESLFAFDSNRISIDTAMINESKLKELETIGNKLAKSINISPEMVADAILQVYDAQDFEHNFYRYAGLIILSDLYRFDPYSSGIMRELPLLEETNTKERTNDPENLLEVYITHEDKILLDGEHTELSALRSSAKAFILKADQTEINVPLLGNQMTSKAIIRLHNDRGTSYDMYLKVQNELIAAYREIRDMKAREFFNKDFDKLDDQQRNSIERLVPRKISEADPVQ
ncbi:MAG: hypothetical protein JW801_03685 [Bacteroidales bacterium]|nr:hypothetical protein [Bacteroidales bacterium]